MKIAVVGVGRVGLPLAAVISKYYDTIGLDVNEELVKKINNRSIELPEPYINEYIEKYGLVASTDFSVTKKCDIVFICVGTQLSNVGYSDTKVINAIKMLEKYLTKKEQLLVISSTVPPWSFNEGLGKSLMNNIKGVCYNPAMIALGEAVRNFENPHYILIGESNPEAGAMLESFWRRIVGNNIPIFRHGLTDIALAKYALNTALVMNISMINLFTEISEKLGSDIDTISTILKADPRISGFRPLKGGLGFGGPCFLIDVEALAFTCLKMGINIELANAIKLQNDRQVSRSVKLIKSLGRKRVAILGITYKPNTSIIENSQAVEIAKSLIKEGLDIIIYDPVGLDAAKSVLGNEAQYAESIKEALNFGEVIFIAVEWPEFRNLDKHDFREDHVLIDPWRILRKKELPCKYFGYGLGLGF